MLRRLTDQIIAGRRSLKWQLQAWHALVLGLVIVTFAASLYLTRRRTMRTATDRELSAAVTVLTEQIRFSPGPRRPGGDRRGPPERPQGPRFRPEDGPPGRRPPAVMPNRSSGDPRSERPVSVRPQPGTGRSALSFPAFAAVRTAQRGDERRSPESAGEPGREDGFELRRGFRDERDGRRPPGEPRPRRPGGPPLPADLRVPDTFAPRIIRSESEAPYVFIWDRQGEILFGSTDAVASAPPADSLMLTENQTVSSVLRFRDRDEFREAYLRIPPGITVLAGRSVAADRADLSALMGTLIGVGSVVFVLGLAGGWFVSGRSVRPISDISQVAASVSESRLSDRIDTAEMPSELADLGGTLNRMLGRLEAAFERQRQFTADASHELRTPLSVLQIHQQLALAKERSPEEYRQTLETCQRAAQQMHGLIESLLSLARLDEADGPDQAEPVDLRELVRQALRDIGPLAEARRTEILFADTKAGSGDSGHTESGSEKGPQEACIVHGNRARLLQVIANLLMNAVVHTPEGTQVEVSLRRAGEFCVLMVGDNGPGIPEEHLPRIFERFYRGDKSRSREQGSTGLGLSISHEIARLHGGSLTARNRRPTGAEFELRLRCRTDRPE